MLWNGETTGREAFDWTGPYQVESDRSSEQEAQVDVDGVVLVLNNPGQATNYGTDNEGEDQQGLEQFGRVGQSAVEVHLWTQDTFPDLCSPDAALCYSRVLLGAFRWIKDIKAIKW